MRGWILGRSERESGALLVHAAGGRGEGVSDDVVYVTLGAVEAITIHDAGQLAVDPVGRSAPPPSRLELARAGREVESTLVALGARASCELPEVEPGEAAWVVKETLTALGPIMKDMGADEDGKAALAGLAKVQIEVGTSAAVSRSADALRITVTVGPERLTREELGRRIAAIL